MTDQGATAVRKALKEYSSAMKALSTILGDDNVELYRLSDFTEESWACTRRPEGTESKTPLIEVYVPAAVAATGARDYMLYPAADIGYYATDEPVYWEVGELILFVADNESWPEIVVVNKTLEVADVSMLLTGPINS